MMERCTGTCWLALSDAPLDVGGAFAFLQDERAGGHCLFVGTTRGVTEGRETTHLYYEAYAPMALGEMGRLADEATGRWPILKVCLHHRTRDVPAPEASVIVGVAAAHRAPAFEAARWLIDTLKRQVPIWKRETFGDGSVEWVEGQVPDV